MDWQPLLLSLKIGSTATLVSLVVGLPAAWLLSRPRFPLRRLWSGVLTLPLVLPPTVLGYYLLLLIGRRGPVGRLLEEGLGLVLVFTWQAGALAAGLVALPLVVRTAQAAFESIDRDLEESARVCGLGFWGMFWRMGLPLAWPGVAAGTVLAFARSLGEFGATLMVAGNIPGRTQTLAIAVYDAVQAGRDDQAAALSLVLSGVSLLAILALGHAGRARTY